MGARGLGEDVEGGRGGHCSVETVTRPQPRLLRRPAPARAACSDPSRLDERRVVLFDHVGVPLGEVGDRSIERVRRAEVRGDRDGVAAAGMSAGQGRGAQGGVSRHSRDAQSRDVDGAAHLAQAAPVVAATVGSGVPARAQEDVGPRLDEALAGNDPLAGALALARAEMRLEDRSTSPRSPGGTGCHPGRGLRGARGNAAYPRWRRRQRPVRRPRTDTGPGARAARLPAPLGSRRTGLRAQSPCRVTRRGR